MKERMMNKYLPALLAAILCGMTLNSAFAAEPGDVDDVTMDVIEHSDPHAVTNDIQLPDEASQEARDHIAGSDDDADHAHDAHSESHDNASDDANEDSHAAAEEDAHNDSKEAAQEDAHDNAQDAAQEQANEAKQDASDSSPSESD
jgi:hypothetical protein